MKNNKEDFDNFFDLAQNLFNFAEIINIPENMEHIDYVDFEELLKSYYNLYMKPVHKLPIKSQPNDDGDKE